MLWKYHGHRGRGTTTTRPKCGSTALGAPDFVISFFLLSGLHSPEGLSGSTIAEHTMQQPGKQKATSSVQVVSITSKIPVLHTVPQLAPSGGHVK